MPAGAWGSFRRLHLQFLVNDISTWSIARRTSFRRPGHDKYTLAPASTEAQARKKKGRRQDIATHAHSKCKIIQSLTQLTVVALICDFIGGGATDCGYDTVEPAHRRVVAYLGQRKPSFLFMDKRPGALFVAAMSHQPV
jgi:hypothetical protein